MPLCTLCGEDADSVTECKECGAKFCEFCGAPDDKLCEYCIDDVDNEDDDWIYEDWSEENPVTVEILTRAQLR